MTSSFDQALEESLDLLNSGASVDDCLARYPEHAEELRPVLEVFSSSAQTARAYSPDPQAKERGRARLQAEMAQLGAAPLPGVAASPLSRVSSIVQDAARGALAAFRGTRPRRFAAVAAVLAIFLFSGAFTVAASQNALPGDTLYGVKRASEDVRVALEFSPAEKAELHARYAARRAGELGELLKQGEAARADTAIAGLRDHVQRAAALGESLGPQAGAAVSESLQESSSQALARLDAAFGDAVSGTDRAAEQSLASASEAYARALEGLSAKTEDRYVSAAPGIVQLRASDPPPPDAEAVMVTVAGVQGYRVAGENSRWVDFMPEARAFDLLRVAETPVVLADTDASSGSYTRLRFEVTEAAVVRNGQAEAIEISGGALTITRPFNVRPGELTVVVLDFDGQESIRTENGRFVMTPAVTALVDDPASRRSERTEEAAANVEIVGPVKRAEDGAVTVRGKRIDVPEGVPGAELAREGAVVRARASADSSGGLTALGIELARPFEGGTVPTVAPTPSKTPTPTPARSVLRGRISAVGQGSLTVDGVEVTISGDTRVTGRPAQGAEAVVMIEETGSGLAQALEVRVLTTEPTPTPGSPPGTPGASPTQSAEPVVLTGVVESVDATGLVVEGTAVDISGLADVIRGVLAPGARVRVTGEKQDDGAVVAAELTVLAGAPTVEPTVPAPTEQPTVPVPTIEPTVPAPTEIPTVPAPTEQPTVSIPTIEPTVPVPTQAPTVPAPTGTLTPRPPATPPTQPTATVPAPTVELTPTVELPVTEAPTPTSSPSPVPTPSVEVVEGVLEDVDGPLFRVNGVRIEITASTTITGALSLSAGMEVRVEGRYLSGDVLTAESVEVISGSPDDSPSTPTVP